VPRTAANFTHWLETRPEILLFSFYGNLFWVVRLKLINSFGHLLPFAAFGVKRKQQAYKIAWIHTGYVIVANDEVSTGNRCSTIQPWWFVCQFPILYFSAPMRIPITLWILYRPIVVFPPNWAVSGCIHVHGVTKSKMHDVIMLHRRSVKCT